MSKNFTAKTSPKWILWSILTALIVLVGGIVMAFAGVNNAVETNSCQKLVVNVTMYETMYETEQDNIADICEKAIKDAGLKTLAAPSMDNKTTSEHDIVYSFALTEDLTELKETLQATLRAAYPDRDITTMSYQQAVLEKLPGGYAAFLVRNLIAGVVIAVLAFVYVSLRYKLWNGIVTFISAGATAAIACGLVVATRVVITASVMYGVLFAMLLSVALSVLFAAKNQKAEKEGGALTEPEALSEAVPVCDTLKLCGFIAAALVVIGVVGIFCAANFAWFALVAGFGVLSAAYSALLLAPSLYLVIRKKFAKLQADRARYDYKKGAKPTKKAEAPAAETEETKAE